MPNNDQFRIEDLRHRLDSLTSEWLEIRDECDEAHKRIDDEIAKKQAAINWLCTPILTRKVVSFLADNDSCFAKWAAEVVDAFGIEVFPYYLPTPPVLAVLNEKHIANRQQLLTGVDDAIQAGLRIIMWCAATVKPAFVLPADSEWYLQVNLRNSVKTWASHCVIGNGLEATADPETLSCVGTAFEDLAKPCSMQPHEEAAYCQQSKILQELRPNLFKSRAHFKKFLDHHPEIKTISRGQRLLVHVGYLFKVLADIRQDTEEPRLDAIARGLEEIRDQKTT